ncbi:MAG: putative enoyl-CoA hydratase 1 [Syntrophus sp. SKADARSKE-3]|nr:putative enoyl-CoA hydratase 1 [Syntrophus sp. SKADARSKE-3]
MAVKAAIEKYSTVMGKEVFLSDWKEVVQEQINQFADATDDHQWIHVDVEKAKQGPFGKPIAHGFLTLSNLSYFSYQMPVKFEGSMMTINYGLNKVRFINPVPVGSKIRDRIVLSALEEKPNNRLLMTTTHTIEIEGSDTPACIAEFLAMVFF